MTERTQVWGTALIGCLIYFAIAVGFYYLGLNKWVCLSVAIVGCFFGFWVVQAHANYGTRRRP